MYQCILFFQKKDVDYDNMDSDAYLSAAFQYNAAATKLQIDGNFTLDDTKKNENTSSTIDIEVISLYLIYIIC